MRILTLLCCAGIATAVTAQCQVEIRGDNQSHTLSSPDAPGAWMEFRDALVPPKVPASWKTSMPSREERAKFYLPFVTALQDKAKDFYTRFPKDKHALDARKQEFELTAAAVQLGATNQQARLDAVEKSLLSEPSLTENDRFGIRQNDVQRLAGDKESEGEAASMAVYEKGARALQKEFPTNSGPFQMLIQVARDSEAAKAREILREIGSGNAPDNIKEQAASELKKLDSVGKPVEIEFTAVDGREVDLAKLKGKVVLVDFWATWCGPCVAELPHVEEAYDKLHAKGFEIVGISLDKDKARLTRFVEDHKMGWPQYFDGLYWQNKLAVQYGIQSIPAMWLLDKKGVLRDVNARANLDAEVTRLLAE